MTDISEKMIHAELQRRGYKEGDRIDNAVLLDVKRTIKGGVAEKVVPDHFTVFLPPEVVQYRDDIRRFVDAMVFKLAKNAHKGRWEDTSVKGAFSLLQKEVEELRAEIGGNMVATLLEAADVANFAMIVGAIAIERGE